MAQHLCSIDQCNDAACVCVCALPMLGFCKDCAEKHRLMPGFHFLIPISAYTPVESQKELRDLQKRLFGLSTAFDQLKANYRDVEQFQEAIEFTYGSLLHSLERIKTSYIEKGERIKQELTNIAEKAIAEAMESPLEDPQVCTRNPLMWMLWRWDAAETALFESFRFRADPRTEFLEKAFDVAVEVTIPGLEDMSFGCVSTDLKLNVSTSAARVFQITASSSDRVLDLKAKVQEAEGIPVEYQQLSYNDRILQSDRLLSDYRIKPQSFLSLTVSKIIRVYVKSKELNLAFLMDSRDFIQNLKVKIQEAEGIAIDAQILSCGPTILDDMCIFDDYGIGTEAVLELKTRCKGWIRVGVACGNGIVLHLEVDTIQPICNLIQEVQKKACHKSGPLLLFSGPCILYNDEILDKSLSLGAYYIPHNATLTFLPAVSPQTHISVMKHDSVLTKVSCNPKMKVGNLKRLIARATSIPPGEMLLQLGEWTLCDMYPLTYYNIPLKVSITLKQRLANNEVTVVLPSMQRQIIPVDMWDPVGSLCSIIEETQGIPQQSLRVVSNGQLLDKSEALRSKTHTETLNIEFERTMEFQISIIVLGMGKVRKNVDPTMTVAELKEEVQRMFSISRNAMSLFYGQVHLEGESTLQSNGVRAGGRIYVIRR